MPFSKAYPYLIILLKTVISAAPNVLKAPGTFFTLLAEQLKKQSEKENKELNDEIKRISEDELHSLIKETGCEQSEIIESISLQVKKLPDILNKLNYRFNIVDTTHDEIISLLHKLLDKETPPKQYLKHIPSTITTFTGRENDLTELHNLLEEKRTVLLLNGLGGIGKTTAAQEYAQRKYDYYDSIIWLDYLDSFESSFVKLNEHLCIDCKPEEVYQQIISEL